MKEKITHATGAPRRRRPSHGERRWREKSKKLKDHTVLGRDDVRFWKTGRTGKTVKKSQTENVSFSLAMVVWSMCDYNGIDDDIDVQTNYGASGSKVGVDDGC